MAYEELERVITQLVEEKPEITDDEVLNIVQEARKKALLYSVPEYNPIKVQDKEKISTEYEERRRKIERKQYQDESTEEFDLRLILNREGGCFSCLILM